MKIDLEFEIILFFFLVWASDRYRYCSNLLWILLQEWKKRLLFMNDTLGSHSQTIIAKMHTFIYDPYLYSLFSRATKSAHDFSALMTKQLIDYLLFYYLGLLVVAIN